MDNLSKDGACMDLGVGGWRPRCSVVHYAQSHGKDDRSVPTAHTDYIVVITVELIAIPEHWLLWSERRPGRRAWPRYH